MQTLLDGIAESRVKLEYFIQHLRHDSNTSYLCYEARVVGATRNGEYMRWVYTYTKNLVKDVTINVHHPRPSLNYLRL